MDQETAQALAGAEMAVGHRPIEALQPQDLALFRAFQSNLLSLISHELRTPLTGILNALSLLDQKDVAEALPAEELVRMARANAQRLHMTLAALLDLAALESGTFHARLKEVNLERLAENRLAVYRKELQENGLLVETVLQDSGTAPEGAALRREVPLLGDPQKLGRAIELCFQVLLRKGARDSEVKLRISSSRLALSFHLRPGGREAFEQEWAQAMMGYKAGVATPGSAFAGTLQWEEAFLTRAEEGLGSEFLLIHEIMRLHQGSFSHSLTQAGNATLFLEFPELSSEEGLIAVIGSRAHQASTELSSVTLGLIYVPRELAVEEFRNRIRKALFRSSDAVYSLPKRRMIAIVLDDCKPEDAPKLLERIEKSLDLNLKYGVSHCPSESSDPHYLVRLAERRLMEE